MLIPDNLEFYSSELTKTYYVKHTRQLILHDGNYKHKYIKL